jgi:anthranilate/para-aminobenzoate synthase component I
MRNTILLANPMIIKPDRNTFELLRENHARVPVCAEAHFPDLDPARLYRLLFNDSPYAFLLESDNGPEETARYSFLGKGETPVLRSDSDSSSSNGKHRDHSAHCRDLLEQLNFFPGANPAESYLPHFWGGWVGYLSYEAGRWFESLPQPRPDTLDYPDLYFMRTEHLAVYDHKTETLRIITAVEHASYDRCVEEVGEIWERVGRHRHSLTAESVFSSGASTAKETTPAEDPLPNTSLEQFVHMVERAKRYIADGDIYQANLAQRFTAPFTKDPFDLFLRLRAVNPSPFSGFLKYQDMAIVSSSPERLVRLEGGRLHTRPIAGTRPRGKTPDEDLRLSRELILNEKEKAEHLMLVDLERNDLGRICRYGSVHVTDLMFLERYSHVSHIVSDIEGVMLDGVTVADILKALFPGGTVTGCPKIRCMEIIGELETCPRGPYSGSLGYIGFAPVMDLNIIIRTIIVKDGKAVFHAGAGIVADSVPEREYQETLDKAAAMLHALAHLA